MGVRSRVGGFLPVLILVYKLVTKSLAPLVGVCGHAGVSWTFELLALLSEVFTVVSYSRW